MTDRPIRIGVQLQPQHAPRYGMIRDAVLRAEDAGVNIAFNWDHFFPLYPDAQGDTDGPHFECWTMLGAWAEQTERIEIGALVTGGGYRNPDLLADMARTVDHMSDGRLILGIGAGWFAKDYEAYGYGFGTKGSRIDLLGANLDRIAARLPRLDPPPTRDIPVLIGGGGLRKTLRHVARHADIWHSFADPDGYPEKLDALNRHCADVGRNPAEIERSVPWPTASDDGHTPEQRADQLVAQGATLFTVAAGGPDYDFSELRQALSWRDSRA
ncbi:LLM class F420-dependent oxidoreductase [Tomitella fengzijianii]|uniref:LLM class F420-dependent oxidoreductase n=1 Tax=Tomitella fengzijianii TaxID=2597660 RepID=UPI00131BEB1E|nr:LLM class F420-dependent oxidoreductase [Tomitella fengzijianii]